MSTKVLSILAIIGTLCVIALIALQVMELTYYSADPSVWPVVQ